MQFEYKPPTPFDVKRWPIVKLGRDRLASVLRMARKERGSKFARLLHARCEEATIKAANEFWRQEKAPKVSPEG